MSPGRSEPARGDTRPSGGWGPPKKNAPGPRPSPPRPRSSATLNRPASPEELARMFQRANRARVAEILETLVALGKCREVEAGRYGGVVRASGPCVWVGVPPTWCTGLEARYNSWAGSPNYVACGAGCGAGFQPALRLPFPTCGGDVGRVSRAFSAGDCRGRDPGATHAARVCLQATGLRASGAGGGGGGRGPGAGGIPLLRRARRREREPERGFAAQAGSLHHNARCACSVSRIALCVTPRVIPLLRGPRWWRRCGVRGRFRRPTSSRP